MHETRRHPARRQNGRAAHDRSQQPRRPLPRDVRVVGLKHVFGQRTDQVRPLMIGVALEAAEADVAEGQARQHRRARRTGLIAPIKLFPGLDQGEGAAGGDAQGLQHLGRQHFAHPALQRQPPVGGPRPRSAAGALGPQVQQPIRARLAQLGEEKAAPVAQVGVVVTELMAVIAHGQRLTEIAWQGLKSHEGGPPFLVVQRIEAHRGRRAIVAKADQRLRKLRRPHRIGELGAQGGVTRVGAIGGGNGHAPSLRRAALSPPGPRAPLAGSGPAC